MKIRSAARHQTTAQHLMRSLLLRDLGVPTTKPVNEEEAQKSLIDSLAQAKSEKQA